MVPLTIPLASLEAHRPVALEGETFHVQGIVVRGATLWLTATDREKHEAWLFEYDAGTGQRRRAKNITHGERTHPGGLSLAGETLWIPVAENRNGGRSVVLALAARTLATEPTFEVDDHIGAVAHAGDRLFGANWDARQIYEWTPQGAVARKRANPTGGRYQDMKFAAGRLIASGMEGQAGVIRWLDPETLLPSAEIRTGRTGRNVWYTNEGMDVADGRLYLLPEDAPSRLYSYSLPPGFPE